MTRKSEDFITVTITKWRTTKKNSLCESAERFSLYLLRKWPQTELRRIYLKPSGLWKWQQHLHHMHTELLVSFSQSLSLSAICKQRWQHQAHGPTDTLARSQSLWKTCKAMLIKRPTPTLMVRFPPTLHKYLQAAELSKEKKQKIIKVLCSCLAPAWSLMEKQLDAIWRSHLEKLGKNAWIFFFCWTLNSV